MVTCLKVGSPTIFLLECESRNEIYVFSQSVLSQTFFRTLISFQYKDGGILLVENESKTVFKLV